MKKWFIYVGDHHEGPFTVEEIRQGISEGRFSESAFVWCQGMSDWKPMAEIDEFKAASAEAAPAPAPVAPEPLAAPMPAATDEATGEIVTGEITPVNTPAARSLDAPEVMERKDTAVGVAAAVARAETKTDTRTLTTLIEVKDTSGNTVASSDPKVKAKLEPAAPVAVAPAGGKPEGIAIISKTERTQPFDPSAPGKPARKSPAKSGGGLFSSPALRPIVAVAAVALSLVGLKSTGLLDRGVAAFLDMVSGVPNLPDVEPADLEALKAAAKTSLSQGPAVAVAVGKGDPLAPSLYIASNLPKGAKFDVFVRGIPNTLLNTLEFSERLEAPAEKRVAKTPAIRYPDGKPLPRGEYDIYVMESGYGQNGAVNGELARLAPISRKLPDGLPKERKIVYAKRLFLGTRDQSYVARLKEFHDQLNQKADQEILELKQVRDLLDSQEQTLLATFDRLKRQKIGPRQKKAWSDAGATWSRLDGQLRASLSKMTPEALEKEFIHGNLYQVAQSATQKLGELKQLQDSLFTAGVAFAQAEGKLAELQGQLDGEMNRFRKAISSLERAPRTEDGLPRKLTAEEIQNGGA